MSTTTNGRPQRKQLSDQLDRLDQILDVLAGGLSGAVAEAVRDGTRLALKDLLTEALADPAIVDRLRVAILPTPPSSPPPPPLPSSVAAPPRPSFWARCQAVLRRMTSTVVDAVKTVVAPLMTIVRTLRILADAFDAGRPLQQAVIVALGAGLVVAAAATVSHPVATVLSGIAAGTTAFAIRIAFWGYRVAHRLTAWNS